MGIAHYQDAGWGGVHGFTNGYNVFDIVSDLKQVKTLYATREYDKKEYSGIEQTLVANATKFYRIDDEYIIFNCPPMIKIK